LGAKQNQLSDTANVTTKDNAHLETWRNLSNGVADSLTSTTATGRATYSISTNGVNAGTAVGTAFSIAGTYTYNFYLTGSGAGNVLTLDSGATIVTWTVTVTAPSTNATGGSATVYISSDTLTAMNNHADWLSGPRSSDSAIVASKGTAAAPKPVGFAYLNLFNAAGDSRVAIGNGFNAVQDSVTVTVSGPGLVYAGALNGSQTAPAKAATMSISNGRTPATNYASETLVIYSDGTAGTMTITFTKGSTTLSTKTVTFYGDPASAVGVSLNDTHTYLGVSSVTLTARVFDAASGAGNILSAGTLYVFSSDTAIAGAVPTSAVFGQTGHRCTTFTGSTAATYRLSCSVAVTDTGTVTLTVGDSWTVAGSSFTSTAVTLTIGGNKVKTASVSFDKATYAPGEAAVVTITATDPAGRNFGSNGTTGLASAFTKAVFTPQLSYATQDLGTQRTSSPTTTSFVNLNDGAIETRVVIMPTYGTDVKFELTYNTFGGVANSDLTTVSATAKVVDPNATAIAAAQAAANAAGAAATAAADAATDAALEAIDAANAATDAANLAAEAADAATVAAEEARDAADAATAAVEALATEVATLMAALKAQITTLARTVAKIAKKVNA
jgi:hypothetical protein